jgi:tRNA pseudouridine55 synthase
MARRRKGRPVNGILVLDKPLGHSSNGAMIKVRAIYNAAKTGHTGALDPLATGVLPICLGEATKFSQYLLDADKIYRSDFRFGQCTETCDAEGQIIAECDPSGLRAEQVEAALTEFRGDIEQVPPMYSALKRDGKPLYELARKGIEVERKPRPVHISRFDMLSFQAGNAATGCFEIACSKGTYIRSLAVDLGQALGVGAHVATLRRLQAGPFTEAMSHSLDEIQALRDAEDFAGLDGLLLPVDMALDHLPRAELGESAAYYLRQGQAVQVSGLPVEGQLRLYDTEGVFMGIGEILDDGRVKPRRLLANM